tara:strand:+ start:596 stop:814 length:219 start_codon:yes stop_codon:yes gene_type:complete
MRKILTLAVPCAAWWLWKGGNAARLWEEVGRAQQGYGSGRRLVGRRVDGTKALWLWFGGNSLIIKDLQIKKR